MVQNTHSIIEQRPIFTKHLLDTRHFSKYFMWAVSSFNLHNKPLRWVLLFSPFTDRETETQRTEVALLGSQSWQDSSSSPFQHQQPSTTTHEHQGSTARTAAPGYTCADLTVLLNPSLQSLFTRGDFHGDFQSSIQKPHPVDASGHPGHPLLQTTEKLPMLRAEPAPVLWTEGKGTEGGSSAVSLEGRTMKAP